MTNSLLKSKHTLTYDFNRQTHEKRVRQDAKLALNTKGHCCSWLGEGLSKLLRQGRGQAVAPRCQDVSGWRQGNFAVDTSLSLSKVCAGPVNSFDCGLLGVRPRLKGNLGVYGAWLQAAIMVTFSIRYTRGSLWNVSYPYRNSLVSILSFKLHDALFA